MDGWAQLGAALGGDSEKAHQEGLLLGAKTEDALATARERVTKNRAMMQLEADQIAAGVDPKIAKANATVMMAGGGLGDLLSMDLKRQERDFRAIAGDPNTDITAANAALRGVASGPVDRFQKVGGGYDDRFDAAGLQPLGDMMGDAGGDAASIQTLRAFGLIGPDGRVAPGQEELAFDVMRSTQRTVDAAGVPYETTGNPFARRGAPGPRPVVPPTGGPAPVAPPAPAAPPVQQMVPTPTVAGNAAAIASAKEQGAAQGRNAAGLESTFTTIDKFTQDIDNFLAMPGFDSVYGNVQGQPLVAPIVGMADQDAANAQAQLATLGGEAFLASIQKMRGFGQLSNQEGAKVETALSRATNAKIGSPEARAAWAEVKVHMAELKRVAAIEAGQAPGTAAPPGGVLMLDDYLKSKGY